MSYLAEPHFSRSSSVRSVQRSLLISEIFPPKTGGSGRWFWEIYRRLPRSEFVIAAGQDSRQVEFDGTHDLDVRRLPLAMRQWGLRSREALVGYGRAIRQLQTIVKSEDIRQIHAGRCLPEGLMALALKLWHGIPYLCYAHGEEYTCAGTSRELRWLIRRVLNSARLVICNSRNTRDMLRSEWRVPDRRLIVMHPGVDTEWFVPAPRDAAVRGSLGWGDRPVVLTVGRLQKRKGHDMMIRALRQIRAAIPDVLYAIVGDGEERAALERLTADEGVQDSVRFHGEPTDKVLRQCYQQCDLFALPNRQVGEDIEGFGMVLVEAQSCGKPVIAGKSGGTAETMRVGETGELVDCRTPESLAISVSQLLADSNRLAAMSRAARPWVVEQFDWTGLSRTARVIFCGKRSKHDNLATLIHA